MEDRWLHEHMGNILVGIEILWVGLVIAIFSLYFIVKRNLRKKKEQELAKKAAAEAVEEFKEGDG